MHRFLSGLLFVVSGMILWAVGLVAQTDRRPGGVVYSIWSDLLGFGAPEIRWCLWGLVWLVGGDRLETEPDSVLGEAEYV
jgi:hypothetical protein